MGLKFTSDEIASYEAVLAKASVDTLISVAERGISAEIGSVGLDLGARIFFVFLLNYLEQHHLSVDDESGCLSLLMRRNSMKELKFISTIALISLPELISLAVKTAPHTLNAPVDGTTALFVAVSAGIGLALFDPIRDAFILFYKEWEQKKKIDEAREEKEKQEQEEIEFYEKRAEGLIQGFISYLVERQRLDIEEGKKRRARELALKKLETDYAQEIEINAKIRMGRKLGFDDRKIYRDLMKIHHPDKGGNLGVTKEINRRYNKIFNRFLPLS